MLQRFQHLYQSNQGASPRFQADQSHAADTGFFGEIALGKMSVPTSAVKLVSKRSGGFGKVSNHDLAWSFRHGERTMIWYRNRNR
jgi:hypothetical protein